MFYLILNAVLITAMFMCHGYEQNWQLWLIFDDLRWNAEFSLAEDAARAENRLNYLAYYRRLDSTT